MNDLRTIASPSTARQARLNTTVAGLGTAVALVAGTLARFGNLPGGWTSVLLAAAAAGGITALLLGAIWSADRLATREMSSTNWMRPARWITLLVGVSLEMAARLLGWPTWMRLLVIAVTIAAIVVLSMTMNTVTLSEVERRQKARSIAIAGVLFALVGIFYAATIVRLGPNALNREGYSRPATVVPASGTAPAAAPNCKQAGTC